MGTSKLKRRFASVKNTVAHPLSIFTMFGIKFLENAWVFNRGVTQRNELQWVVSDSVPKVAVLWVSRFLVPNYNLSVVAGNKISPFTISKVRQRVLLETDVVSMLS